MDPDTEQVAGRTALTEGAQALGIGLDERAMGLFTAYHDLLLTWSGRFNLIGPAAVRDLWGRHFLDALTLVRALPDGLTATGSPPAVLDVGSGAGLPGIPLAIAFPGWRVTLLEATGKKAQFLDMAAHELALSNLSVVQGRAEEVAHEREHREAYDLCVARAVGITATLVELTLPFARRGGDAVLYKGLSGLSEEIQAAEPARTILGAAAPVVVPISLIPGGARCLVRYAKQEHTPAALPRRAGMPEHQPLTAVSAAHIGATPPPRERGGRRG